MNISTSNISNLINLQLAQVDFSIKNIISHNQNFLSDIFLDFIFLNSKKLRPIIAILTIKALGLTFSQNQALLCALVEIIHNASLIHDDIIDNADLRRNKPSFNNHLGCKTAVLAGDFLIAVCLKELFTFNNQKINSLFINSFSELCNGEISQLQDKNIIPSWDRYLQKCKNKTASLFNTALQACFIAENALEYLDFAENFAFNFGLAFQIRDDILDFSGKNIGKPVFNDFKNGNYTAPAIFYAQDNNLSRFNESDLDKIVKSSAITKANDLCRFYVNKTLDLLSDFSDNQYTLALKNLCNSLIE